MADVGKIVNRWSVDGQIYGGMAQGIGLALTEDFEDIKKHTTMLVPASRTSSRSPTTWK